MRALLLTGLAAGAVACGLLTAAPAGRREPVLVAVTQTVGEHAATEVHRFRPDGTPLPPITIGQGTDPPARHRVAPDGVHLVAEQLQPLDKDFLAQAKPEQLELLYHHVLLDLSRPEPEPEPFGPAINTPSAVWSTDGKKVYGTSIRSATPKPFEGEPLPFDAWVYDLATKVRTPLALPKGHEIADLSPDGRTLLTVRRVHGGGIQAAETYLVPLATLKPARLTEAVFHGQRFSPDGRRVIGVTPSRPYNPNKRAGIAVVSVGGGPVDALVLPAELYDSVSACWSPDGRRVAYVWSARAYADRLSVADADGRNPTVLLANKTGSGGYVQGVDWR